MARGDQSPGSSGRPAQAVTVVSRVQIAPARDCEAIAPDYGAEIADTICDRLAGGESLRAICADAGMPDRATVSRWLARYEEFRDLYGFAREWQADCLVDEMLKIARDSSRDYLKKVGVDGKVTWVVDREHIARCGLRISALKWTAARMAPRKYGNPRC
jgi:hypothetical protein